MLVAIISNKQNCGAATALSVYPSLVNGPSWLSKLEHHTLLVSTFGEEEFEWARPRHAACAECG